MYEGSENAEGGADEGGENGLLEVQLRLHILQHPLPPRPVSPAAPRVHSRGNTSKGGQDFDLEAMAEIWP